MSWAQEPPASSTADAKDGAAKDGGEAAAQHQARLRHLQQRARAYHGRHADWVGEFNSLTQGACADSSGGIDYRRMRAWQSQHHIKVDGLIGPNSLELARKLHGQQAPGADGAPPPEAKPESKPEAKPEAKPDVKSDAKPPADARHPIAPSPNGALAPDPEAADIAVAADVIDEATIVAPVPEPGATASHVDPAVASTAKPVVPTTGVRETSANEVNSKRGSKTEFAHAASGFRKLYKIGKFEVLVFLPEHGIVPPDVDVFLYFHGMYADFATEKTNGFQAGDDNPAKGADMAGAVTASARNVIAIMPLAPSGASANWEALAGSDKKIVDTVLANLSADLGIGEALTPGRISLAGHSRGGVGLGDAAKEMMDSVTDITLQDAGYGGGSFEDSFEKVRDWLLLGKGPKTLRLITQDKADRKERNTEKNTKKGLNETSFSRRIAELRKEGKIKEELTVTAQHSGDKPKHFSGAFLETQVDITGPGGKQGSMYVMREQTNHFGVRNQSTAENLKAVPDGIGFGLSPLGEPKQGAPQQEQTAPHADDAKSSSRSQVAADDQQPKTPSVEDPKPADAVGAHDKHKADAHKPKADAHKPKQDKGPKHDALGNLADRIDPESQPPQQGDRIFTNSFTVMSHKAQLLDAQGKKTGEILPAGTEVHVYKANHMRVQVATIDPKAAKVVQQSEDRWLLFATLGGNGSDVELGNESSDAEDKLRADKLRGDLPAGREPGKSKFSWGFGGGFEPELDGIPLSGSLMGKVHQLMEWAIQNDMVTGDIEISSGMRSPAKAHKLGTSYEIQNMDSRGNVTMASLKALPDGKDLNGTLWYQEGWDKEDIVKNAKKHKSGTAVAAGGYPKGDKHRLPIVGAQPGVSRHCTGHAVDVKIPWRNESGKGTDVWAWENIYHQFGLTRPLHKTLVSGTLQEYWHIEETSKKIDGADPTTDAAE